MRLPRTSEHIAAFGEGMLVLTNEEIEVPGGEDIDGIFYAGASAGSTLRF